MIPVVLVPGTWGGHQDWTAEDSAFCAYLRRQGFEPHTFRGWSGDVDGIPQPFENGRDADWIAGGWALSYFLRDRLWPAIAHSHGGQVTAYAAARAKVRIPALVTICTPVRRDLRDVYLAAKPSIGYWRHVYASGWDFFQRAGELFDGHVGWTRQMPAANDNVGIPGISHSRLLDDPAYYPLWESTGLLDILRGAGAPYA